MVVVTLLIGVLAGGLLYLDIRADAAAGQRHFLLVMGGLVAFSAGGSQVGLALGPLVPLLGEGPTAASPSPAFCRSAASASSSGRGPARRG